MTKADLHRLVDALPTESRRRCRTAAQRVAEDPMIAVLDAAPWDNEPSTPDERIAAAIERLLAAT